MDDEVFTAPPFENVPLLRVFFVPLIPSQPFPDHIAFVLLPMPTYFELF